VALREASRPTGKEFLMDVTNNFATDLQSRVNKRVSLIFGQDVFAMTGFIGAVGTDYMQMHTLDDETYWVPLASIKYVRLLKD
jgi:hypothetical protein